MPPTLHNNISLINLAPKIARIKITDEEDTKQNPAGSPQIEHSLPAATINKLHNKTTGQVKKDEAQLEKSNTSDRNANYRDNSVLLNNIEIDTAPKQMSINSAQASPSSQNNLNSKPSEEVALMLREELNSDWRDPEFHFSVDRDYSGESSSYSMATRFKTDFPNVLVGAVTEEGFLHTINGINSYFAEADEMNCANTMESILSYLTCTLINLCRKTKMEKALDKINLFLYEENDRIYHPIGLHVAHPIARGLRKVLIRSIANYQLYR